MWSRPGGFRDPEAELGCESRASAGHVAGIKKMIEADRYCVEVLKQS